MIYGGDEFANSQAGNNNAWCQDNAVGWTDWKNAKKQENLSTFVKEAIAFRKKSSNPSYATGNAWSGLHGEGISGYFCTWGTCMVS